MKLNPSDELGELLNRNVDQQWSYENHGLSNEISTSTYDHSIRGIRGWRAVR